MNGHLNRHFSILPNNHFDQSVFAPISAPSGVTPSDRNEHGDSRLGFCESLNTQLVVYVVWIIMIAIIMSAYYLVIGIGSKFSIILGIILLVVLISNMMLSGVDSVDPYEVELSLYNYVESNAQSFLPFGIALAALVIASKKQSEILQNKNFLKPLLMATCCFVFVLTIIWMPKDSGLPIRLWRDVKTGVLTLGGVTVVALIGEFVVTHMNT